MIHLSKRLRAVADYVPVGSHLADIGSDHAYLPIVLVEEGVVPYAVAGEVAEGPCHHASTMVSENNVQDKISVRLGDGLTVIQADDDISAIVIAGMGGSLIVNILETGRQAGKLSGKEELILQANVDEYSVRKWLDAHHYRVRDENIIEENQKIYEIIVAHYTNDNKQPLTEEEMYFGRYIEEKNPAVFRKKWESELSKNEYILQQLHPNNPEHFQVYQKFDQQSKRIRERLH